ncbi:unnamed protein product [Sphagnum jensenii]|uniref:Uncharacterized protein n=1 Tax=Sphagnum jensenii TaxID=128206 RepID=A0ABP0W281_9BRYO
MDGAAFQVLSMVCTRTGANPKDLREAIVILQLSQETPSKPKELKESGSGIRRFEESETRSESAEEILSRPEPKFVEETTKTPWIVKETQEMPLPPIMVIQKNIIEETGEGKAIVTTLFEVLEIDESVSSHRNDVMVT